MTSIQNSIDSSVKFSENKLSTIADTIAAPISNTLESVPLSTNTSDEPSTGAWFIYYIKEFFVNNWLSILFWGGLILLIVFLGVNIFNYVNNMITTMNSIIDPILNKTKDLVKNLGGNLQKNKDTADSTDTSENGIDILQEKISKPQDQNDTETTDDDDDIKNVITLQDVDDYTTENTSEPLPFLADSSVQSNKTSGKSGYCYVGTENGIRTCAAVGANNKCMSGDIFPSHEICVDPDLRQ